MTEEELEKRYQSLPPKLKEALSDKKLSAQIYSIGREFKIPEEHLKRLLGICGGVLIGVIPLSELGKQLKKELNISENESQALAEKLDSEIFSKYKDQLSSLQKSSPPSLIKEEKGAIKTSEDKKVIEQREELLRKKRENDPYREPIDEEEKTESSFTLREGGRIRKIL